MRLFKTIELVRIHWFGNRKQNIKKSFFKHVRVFLPSVKVGELINKWTKCGGFEIEEIRNQQAYITDL